MGAYSDIESHRRMTFDEVRNKAYARAMEAAIVPGMTVLDLGAGLGIHGMMAARMGAGKVYLVDPSPVIQQSAELACVNDIDDQIHILRGRIEEVELPQQVDLLVSVLTGNFLLTEDLLPTLFSARERFLKPGGLLIPGKARMRAVLVSAEAYYDEKISRWSEPAFGLDFDPIRKLAANHVYYPRPDEIETAILSEAVTLAQIDFNAATAAECKCNMAVTASRPGTCHGLLGWFDMLLGDQWISTGPGEQTMHCRRPFCRLILRLK